MPSMTITVEKTAAFSLRLPNLAHTLLKSMVLTGTTKSDPNDVRWVQRHCVLYLVVLGPTCDNDDDDDNNDDDN